MTTQYDYENTLEAIRKIRKILNDYDLLGLFTICDQERAHWLYEINCSWSALHIIEHGGSKDLSGSIEAHVKAKRKDFKTKEQHQRVVKNTISALFSSRDICLKQYTLIQDLCEKLEEKFDIDHKVGLGLRHDR